PETAELSEGLLALAVVGLVSGICFASPRENWFTILPLGSLLPLLLWPAARCRPVFAAAAALLLSLAVVSTITLGIGRLGDPSIPLADRITAARASLLFASMTALIFAAVFAERRCSELAFRNTNDRLQLALDGAELGIWSVDLTSGRHENDARDRRNHGHH